MGSRRPISFSNVMPTTVVYAFRQGGILPVLLVCRAVLIRLQRLDAQRARAELLHRAILAVLGGGGGGLFWIVGSSLKWAPLARSARCLHHRNTDSTRCCLLVTEGGFYQLPDLHVVALGLVGKRCTASAISQFGQIIGGEIFIVVGNLVLVAVLPNDRQAAKSAPHRW